MQPERVAHAGGRAMSPIAATASLLAEHRVDEEVADRSVDNHAVTRSLRIVHLEADCEDAESVRASLVRDGLVCDVTRVETREAFLAAVDHGDVDLILADDTPSLEASAALRLSRARWPSIPFLFVSAVSGEEIAVERLKSGARDYVLKHRLGRLPFAVRRALREANERTQRQHAEHRVRELNAKLEIASQEAERANRAKSEFLSRVSHDLRTPLTAILGFAELLDVEALRPDQRDEVQQIICAGRHLLGLINELLDIARIEAGRLTVVKEPVPVNELVGHVVNLVRPLAAQRDVLLVDESGACRDAHLMADRERLTQILLNLLSNAIKYNRPGGRVTVTCTPKAQGQMRLNVTDTGPGLEAEKLRRLFRPFERLGAEQTGTQGTGLGLALSRHLAKAMGGAMGVTSDVGRGSTFWIELAQAVHESSCETRERETPSIRDVPPVRGNVLYIEDNPSNIRLIERVCQLWPEVALVVAKEGRIGVEMAATIQPDLILLDLHLPDVSGEEVLRRLHRNDRTRDIPVVVLSADAVPARIERIRHAGAAAYLTKPFDIPRILNLITTTLGPRHVAV